MPKKKMKPEEIRCIDKFISPQLVKNLLTRKILRTQHDALFRQCNRCYHWKAFTTEHWTLSKDITADCYKSQGRCKDCLNEIHTEKYRERVKQLGKKEADKSNRSIRINGFTYHPLTEK